MILTKIIYTKFKCFWDSFKSTLYFRGVHFNWGLIIYSSCCCI